MLIVIISIHVLYIGLEDAVLPEVLCTQYTVATLAGGCIGML